MFEALLRIFDYSGWSTRWEYWSFFLGFVVLLLGVGAWGASYQNTHYGLQPQFTDDQSLVIGLAVLVLVAAPNLALRVRRYHDFGWSGWAALWALVPLLNVFFELMLLFRGPTEPAVTYTAEPEPRHINIYNTPGSGGIGAPNPHDTRIDQIDRLADMLAQGVLTPEEFATAKARVLRS